MKLRLTAYCVMSLLCCGFVRSDAQMRTGSDLLRSGNEPKASVLFIRIFDEQHKSLSSPAFAKVQNEDTGDLKTQMTQGEGNVVFGDLSPGRYVIEVSAAGYQSSREDVVVGTDFASLHRDISLKRDINAIEQNDSEADLAPKARKEVARAVAALNNSDWQRAQKHLEEVKRIVSSNAELSFLMGYLFFMQKDFSSAKPHLTEAVSLNRQNVRALALLGIVCLKQKNYTEAQEYLQRALALDSENFFARTTLAEAYLRQNEFEKSRVEAVLAIEKSKGRATAAYMIHGLALSNLGKPREAVVALRQYLQDAPNSPSIENVKSAIAQLEQETADNQNTASLRPSVPLTATLNSETDSGISVSTWEPADVDNAKPPVDATVACPLNTLLAEMGERTQSFLRDIARFQAIEEVQHQELNELGGPISEQKVRFDYVADISEYQPGAFNVEEYRVGRSGADFPAPFATRGFPSLALVFHPSLQANFRVTCEGISGWNGKPAWLLYFRQREDRPSTLHSYKIGTNIYPIDLKGRAWVDRATKQIVHIEADIVKPVPQLQLRREHQAVDYGPVMFKAKNVELWLPQRVEIYFNFQRHRFMRRHTFSNFMLFAVDSHDSDKSPTK